MTRAQWAISCCLVWHLVAVAALILPTSSDGRPAPTQEHADRVAAAVAPALDSLATGFWHVQRAVGVVTEPARKATRAYAGGLGFVRHWKMFVPPSRNDQYVRVRYYVGSSAADSKRQPAWAASELVLPAHPSREVRGIAAFRDRRRDKAVDTMADRFTQRIRTRKAVPVLDGFPDDLQPVTRFFSRQFSKDRLLAGERIVRVEVWLGRSPSPPHGTSEDPYLHAAREEVLERYYQGAVESRLGDVRYPPYGAVEQEVDITWRLAFFEET